MKIVEVTWQTLLDGPGGWAESVNHEVYRRAIGDPTLVVAKDGHKNAECRLILGGANGASLDFINPLLAMVSDIDNNYDRGTYRMGPAGEGPAVQLLRVYFGSPIVEAAYQLTLAQGERHVDV